MQLTSKVSLKINQSAEQVDEYAFLYDAFLYESVSRIQCQFERRLGVWWLS